MRPAEDLFGNAEHPRKGAPEYLSWLASLSDLPGKFVRRSSEGLAPGVPADHVDVIICEDTHGKWIQLVLDLRTGQQYRGESDG